MKYIKVLFSLLGVILCLPVIAYDTETPKVDIVEIRTQDGRIRQTENVVPWNRYNFSVKYKNNSKYPVIMRVSFVDGVMTAGEDPRPACKNEWEWELFGNYVTWDTLLRIEEKSELTAYYHLLIPNEVSPGVFYTYSWNLFGWASIEYYL